MNKSLNHSSAIIDALATAIANDDHFIDDIDAKIDTLADLLTANAFLRLMLAIDLCPFHRCDIDICNDDELNCANQLDALIAR